MIKSSDIKSWFKISVFVFIAYAIYDQIDYQITGVRNPTNYAIGCFVGQIISIYIFWILPAQIVLKVVKYLSPKKTA